MFQFLPMIMGMLNQKQKSDEARKQNTVSAMLGQAPTAQGGNMLQGAMGGLNLGKPGAEKEESTDSLLDSSFGRSDVSDEDLLDM